MRVNEIKVLFKKVAYFLKLNAKFTKNSFQNNSIKNIGIYFSCVKESRSWGITPPGVGEVLKNIQENNGVSKK